MTYTPCTVFSAAVDRTSISHILTYHDKNQVKYEHIVRSGYDRLYVRPAPEFETSGAQLLFELERLLRALPGVIVAGVPTVARAVVSREKDTNQVIIEGTNLQVGFLRAFVSAIWFEIKGLVRPLLCAESA